MSSDLKTTILTTDDQERKNTPIYSGVLAYFPAAIAYVAKISKMGNDKHNPGQPLHWARGKSMDQTDTIARHLIEVGTIDPKSGLRHSGFLAWRALANLQLELEREEGEPLSPGSREPEKSDVK
jgi:hypothetical protein